MRVLRKRIFNPLRHLARRSLAWAHLNRGPRHRIYSQNNAPISPEKQAKLNQLCEQLLKKQELITSGKLQFIGLSRIKKRLGKRWKGLSKIVYETAEEVISSHLDDKNDFYIRYKDEVYFLLFVKSSTEEGQEKATAIAEEIRRKLFELDEKELRSLEIRESIGVLNRDYLKDCDMNEFMDVFSDEEYVYPSPANDSKPPPLPEIACVEVESEDYRPTCMRADESLLGTEEILYSYLPLWDVKRSALTTYLCLARTGKQYDNIFDSHTALYASASPERRVALDIEILKTVTRELKERPGDRRYLIACPVHYETLHHFESYELYKQVLQEITEEQREFLILYVMDISQKLPLEDAYWFIKPVKQFCRLCFAELPFQKNINFNYMRNLGVDAVGFRLGDADISKPEVLQMISRFSFRAKGLHIPMTFIFELTSISLATSAIFTEYDFVGGAAIHREVNKPDRMLRFRSEDMLMRLIKQKKAK